MAIILQCGWAIPGKQKFYTFSEPGGSQGCACMLASFDSCSPNFDLIPPRFRNEYSVALDEIFADYRLYPIECTPILRLLTAQIVYHVSIPACHRAPKDDYAVRERPRFDSPSESHYNRSYQHNKTMIMQQLPDDNRRR
jgi:hypothetical protein